MISFILNWSSLAWDCLLITWLHWQLINMMCVYFYWIGYFLTSGESGRRFKRLDFKWTHTYIASSFPSQQPLFSITSLGCTNLHSTLHPSWLFSRSSTWDSMVWMKPHKSLCLISFMEKWHNIFHNSCIGFHIDPHHLFI